MRRRPGGEALLVGRSLGEVLAPRLLGGHGRNGQEASYLQDSAIDRRAIARDNWARLYARGASGVEIAALLGDLLDERVCRRCARPSRRCGHRAPSRASDVEAWRRERASSRNAMTRLARAGGAAAVR